MSHRVSCSPVARDNAASYVSVSITVQFECAFGWWHTASPTTVFARPPVFRTEDRLFIRSGPIVPQGVGCHARIVFML